MSAPEIPREVQRFFIALALIIGFFACFFAVLLISKDVEWAKGVLSILAGIIATIVGFYFGSKSAEMARVLG
jgi:nucleoside recognition membrane protein YjiH